MHARMIREWYTSAGHKAVITRCMGHQRYLCGYVEVSASHPLVKKEWDEIEDGFLVHGGLTYSGDKHPLMKKSDGTWWFGFDCAHGGDDPITCDEGYVASECESLAAQLQESESTK